MAHKEQRKEGCGECKLTRVGSADRGQRKQPAALGILGFWESFLIIKKHEAVSCWSELVRLRHVKGEYSGWQARVNRQYHLVRAAGPQALAL